MSREFHPGSVKIVRRANGDWAAILDTNKDTHMMAVEMGCKYIATGRSASEAMRKLADSWDRCGFLEG